MGRKGAQVKRSRINRDGAKKAPSIGGKFWTLVWLVPVKDLSSRI